MTWAPCPARVTKALSSQVFPVAVVVLVAGLIVAVVAVFLIGGTGNAPSVINKHISLLVAFESKDFIGEVASLKAKLVVVTTH